MQSKFLKINFQVAQTDAATAAPQPRTHPDRLIQFPAGPTVPFDSVPPKRQFLGHKKGGKT
jgi:hypothetical protein